MISEKLCLLIVVKMERIANDPRREEDMWEANGRKSTKC